MIKNFYENESTGFIPGQNGLLSKPIKGPNYLPFYINQNAIEDSKREILIEMNQKPKDEDSKIPPQPQHDQASASTTDSSSENESASVVHGHDNLGDLNSHNTIQEENSPNSEGTYETESTHCDTPIIFVDSHHFKSENDTGSVEEVTQIKDEDYLPPKATKSKKSQVNPKIKGKEGEKPKKAKKQNKMKNFPGLILQRIKTLILKNPAFCLIFLSHFDVKFHKGIKDFIGEYQKEWKTWKSIKAYSDQNSRFGKYVFEAIFFFLADENVELYHEWIDNGRMGEGNRLLAKERRKWFTEKFQELKDGKDIREDDGDDDSISEIPRKYVKL